MSVRRLSDSSVKAKNVGGAGPRMDGRWAVLAGGTVTSVVNPDGTVDEVRTFTTDGKLTVLSPGFARVLIVGGASGYCSQPGNAGYGAGGDVIRGIQALPAGVLAVIVGAGAPTTATIAGSAGYPSALGTLTTGVAGYAAGGGGTRDGTEASMWPGFTDDITGVAQSYSGIVASPRANFGEAALAGAAGQPGIVIVRVRKSP